MEKLEKAIDDYEFEDGSIDHLENDIRIAVMNLAWGGGEQAYRFNQIGAIYTALEQILECRVEMKHAFNRVVEMVPEDTVEAKEES